MGKLKGTTGGGGPRASKAQAAKARQQKSKAAILAMRQASDAAAAATAGSRARELSVAMRQRLLDVFRDTLSSALASPELHDALQALKQALFERDFAAAFGPGADTAGGGGDGAATTIPPLDAYAARWSPTRALCYASVLRTAVVREHWLGEVEAEEEDEDKDEDEDEDKNKDKDEQKHEEEDEEENDPTPLRMVAIGGGAAEIVAFGSLLANGEPGANRIGDLVLVDSGPWASIVGRLQATMTTGKEVGGDDVDDEEEEEENEKEEEGPLVSPDRLAVDVRQVDILTVDDDAMAELIAGDGSAKTLVTLFFTLNELFTAGGLGAAATFLLRLSNAAPAGTVLLVIDSPGSYAETAVGAQAKKYPMKWLLDRFLTQDAGVWTKVYADDSTWCRLTSALTYPIRLEDMRYQSHVYVRQ